MRLMSRILCALSCLCIAPALWADTLLLDKVNGYTLDSTGRLQRFQALLIEDGKVLASGSRDAMKAKAADARVVDGAGHTLLPGLIDAHGHVMGLGVAKLQVDLVGTESLQAALARIRSAATAAPKGKEWMLGRGWNQSCWLGQQRCHEAGRHLSRHEGSRGRTHRARCTGQSHRRVH